MRKFWFNCLMVTVFTFVLMGALAELLQLKIFSAFDPIGQAIGDMELSDIAFSQIREGEPTPDLDVTIVNIGFLSRGEIGDEIRNIVKYKPKVIGLDIIFSCPGTRDSINCPQAFNAENTFKFSSAIAEAEAQGVKVVMAEKLHQTKGLVEKYGDVALYDSIEHTDEELRLNSYEGYVNLDTDAGHQEDLKSCRRVNPSIEVAGQRHLAFSAKIAMLYDSMRATKFLARNKETEIINYRGNTPDLYGASTYSGRYQFLDVEQALDTNSFDPSMIKDKIVIFGFHGETLDDRSWEDKFFTPLNENYAGKTRPDMYGVVVHANVVSMILKEDFVNEMALWQQITLAILVLMLTSALFFKIEEKMPIWYDILSLIIQVAMFALFSLAMILVFSWYSVKLDFTLTLAAVALVGTCFELYNGGILRLYHVMRSKFTKPVEPV
jgi:CHASE2 domain-containing sensor protein